MSRRRKSRIEAIDLSQVPGTQLVSADVVPPRDDSVNLLDCTGRMPDGRVTRLGTIVVGFDLVPTLVPSLAGARLLTDWSARHLLNEVAARLRQYRGIW
jgi:hypothetical protein